MRCFIVTRSLTLGEIAAPLEPEYSFDRAQRPSEALRWSHSSQFHILGIDFVFTHTFLLQFVEFGVTDTCFKEHCE